MSTYTFVDGFSELFEQYQLTQEEIKEYANEFGMVASMTLLAAVQNDLSAEEKEKIQVCVEEKEYEKIGEMVRQKYSEEEWEKILNQHVQPLLQQYVKEVVRKD